uniref:Phage-related baseplate assembly protein n=1 Tax=Candidatus Kentrum eta TaxID=2126337 RepID=A0A450VII4_9GAMM|nr:MAG: Phage-related baseplate assembly protein [Candidatus Kentron sp. H]VFK04599.1 MAG: Phage-related baseplate assembly protein [Candidatus Kentron sp. H]VFK07603.1 MAG: Phage-related baseplate assembly protein [Candidatus Kentron sp. H]
MEKSSACWLLESDPLSKLLESDVYDELLLRQRVNDALRSNLLAFSGGSDLDHLASFYDITRLPSEDDEAFRRRVHANIRGWSPGSTDYYRYHALSVSPEVRDAYADSPEPGRVRVAVLPDADADSSLIDAVRSHLGRRDVRLISDHLHVVEATQAPVRIKARAWTRPDAPPGIVEGLLASFPERFETARGLGWDVARSWIIANLHAEGVKRVVLDEPAGDIVIGSDACAALTDVAISDQGPEW